MQVFFACPKIILFFSALPVYFQRFVIRYFINIVQGAMRSTLGKGLLGQGYHAV